MKDFFRGLQRAIVKILIVTIITSVVIVIISKIWGYQMKNLCMIFGIFYMFLGISAVFGNTKMTSGAGYNYVRASSTDNFSNSIKQDFYLREKSEKFLVYMGITGFMLVLSGGWLK